jgi:hypothetical protein
VTFGTALLLSFQQTDNSRSSKPAFIDSEQQHVTLDLFNGKPQASLLDFAAACGSPLNQNAYLRRLR